MILFLDSGVNYEGQALEFMKRLIGESVPKYSFRWLIARCRGVRLTENGETYFE